MLPQENIKITKTVHSNNSIRKTTAKTTLKINAAISYGITKTTTTKTVTKKIKIYTFLLDLEEKL